MNARHSALTTWHITFGTYGTRLHGGERATVSRESNQAGQAFVQRDPAREEAVRNRMRSPPVHLTLDQRRHIQRELPAICERGGWLFRVCAACDDHVHILLDADRRVHGQLVRRLIKRWLTQAMDHRWPRPACGTWWVEQGSNKAVRDSSYLANVFAYIEQQQCT